MPGDSSLEAELDGGHRPGRIRALEAGALLLLVLPNLAWILLHRGVWVSDAALYGLSSLRLYRSLQPDGIGWWAEMLSIGPKPPLLPWLGQLFVPLGVLLGHADSGLLLVVFVAQAAALVLLFKSLVETLADRRLALLGCLLVASAPLFASICRQFYVQPLQLLAVAWFVFLAARSSRWDSLLLALHLVAASAFAVSTNLTAPALCVLPGALAVRGIWRQRGRPLKLGAGHLLAAVLAATLLTPTLAWYWRNLEAALDYARWSFGYVFSGIGAGYLGSLGRWVLIIQAGFLISLELLLLPLWALRGRTTSTGAGRELALVSLLQIVLVLALFATAAQQEWRYPLPLLIYAAVAVCWGLDRLRRPRLAVSVTAALVLQLLVVQIGGWTGASDRGVVASSQGFQPRAGRVEELMEAILETSAGESVLLATGGLGFFSLELEYLAAKRSPVLKAPGGPYECVEFLLTGSSEEAGSRPDVEAVWTRVLETSPAWVVLANERIRSAQLERWRRSSLGWRQIVEGTDEISRRVIRSDRYERVPRPAYPEIDFFRKSDRPSPR